MKKSSQASGTRGSYDTSGQNSPSLSLVDSQHPGGLEILAKVPTGQQKGPRESPSTPSKAGEHLWVISSEFPGQRSIRAKLVMTFLQPTGLLAAKRFYKHNVSQSQGRCAWLQLNGQVGQKGSTPWRWQKPPELQWWTDVLCSELICRQHTQKLN